MMACSKRVEDSIGPVPSPRRRRSAVQICGHLPGIAVSAFLRAPLCPSWISSKLAKGSRIAPLHTPRRRQCAVQICGHLPGIAVCFPSCPFVSFVDILPKGSRIAPPFTPRPHSGLHPPSPGQLHLNWVKAPKCCHAPFHIGFRHCKLYELWRAGCESDRFRRLTAFVALNFCRQSAGLQRFPPVITSFC